MPLYTSFAQRKKLSVIIPVYTSLAKEIHYKTPYKSSPKKTGIFRSKSIQHIKRPNIYDIYEIPPPNNNIPKPILQVKPLSFARR